VEYGHDTQDVAFHPGLDRLRRSAAVGDDGGCHGYNFRGGRGADPEQASRLLGLGRHVWGDIHFVLALLFVSAILVHVVLHWMWIRTCAKSILLRSHP